MKVQKMLTVIMSAAMLTVGTFGYASASDRDNVLVGGYSSTCNYNSGLGGGYASGVVTSTYAAANSHYASGSQIVTRSLCATIWYKDDDGVDRTATKRKDTYETIATAAVEFTGYENIYRLEVIHDIDGSIGTWDIEF